VKENLALLDEVEEAAKTAWAMSAVSRAGH
jgi:hypothetical protein